MPNFTFISKRHRERYLRIIEPTARFLARMGVRPNFVTFTGLALSVLAGLVYSTGAFFWGAWVLVLAGACDTLDGQLARLAAGGSRFGAFLDSTLDRYGEVAVFLGFAWHFSGGPDFSDAGHVPSASSPWTVLFVLLALSGSMMVSYARARAEGLGAECRSGWMQRTERIVLLVIGSLLGSLPTVGPFFINLTLCVLAILANITAIQRIVLVRRQLRQNAEDE